jgi:gluconolactonase
VTPAAAAPFLPIKSGPSNRGGSAVSVVSRRDFFASAGSLVLAATAASGALARWEPSEVYPDPAVQILDPSFAKYRIAQASVERIATGMRWCEGPVWFGDARALLWSDIPNNRIMRWDEETGRVSVFRKPSNNANGNTRDRQGRLVTCEHDTRRVTRTEYDGTVTVLIDKFDGKPLNSPNDIVVKSDDSIWFTDPPFGILGNYEGHVDKPELPTNVYRLDKTGRASVVTGDVNRPNGLCFSPDETKMYIVEAGLPSRVIRVFDVVENGTRPTAGPSWPARLARRPTASVATSTAICGAAGAWARATTASSCSPRTASGSARSCCPNGPPTSASAG